MFPEENEDQLFNALTNYPEVISLKTSYQENSIYNLNEDNLSKQNVENANSSFPNDQLTQHSSSDKTKNTTDKFSNKFEENPSNKLTENSSSKLKDNTRDKFEENSNNKLKENSSSSENQENPAPRLWISIGLCFSAGNSMKGKNETSYTAVAPFSATLWTHLSAARVILWVVYIK